MRTLTRIMNGAIYTLATALALTEAAKAQTQNAAVRVYVGPQSVSPKKSIYVTIEATDFSGKSLDSETAVLSYQSDGVTKSITGDLNHGLVSFEIPAQVSVGHMVFSATVSDISSNEVFVAVLAGRPQSLSLKAEPVERADSVVIFSNVITDKFGNPVSDLSVIQIDWQDETGLIAQQTSQLLNGRVNLISNCPATFSGELQIKASLDSLQFILPKLNAVCEMAKG